MYAFLVGSIETARMRETERVYQATPYAIENNFTAGMALKVPFCRAGPWFPSKTKIPCSGALQPACADGKALLMGKILAVSMGKSNSGDD